MQHETDRSHYDLHANTLAFAMPLGFADGAPSSLEPRTYGLSLGYRM
jgi:hypothetical protein